jgi:hypothetical protein
LFEVCVCVSGRMVSWFIREQGVCHGGHQTAIHSLILTSRPHLLTIKNKAAGPTQIRYGTKPTCATYTKLTLLKVSGMLSLQQGDHKVQSHTGGSIIVTQRTAYSIYSTAVLSPPNALQIIVLPSRILPIQSIYVLHMIFTRYSVYFPK